MNIKENIKRKYIGIKQFFCKHNWKNINNEPCIQLTDCDMYSLSKLHKCEKCDKEQLLGSGWQS
jgi:hypothetical protein